MAKILIEETVFPKCIVRINNRDPPMTDLTLLPNYKEFDASKDLADLKAKLKAQGIQVD